MYRIRDLREDRDLTQAQIAKILKTTQQQYSKIENGKADITEASCPDHVCVDQRAISKTGEAITCLPNKTVITVDGEEEADIDFVS